MLALQTMFMLNYLGMSPNYNPLKGCMDDYKAWLVPLLALRRLSCSFVLISSGAEHVHLEYKVQRVILSLSKSW